MIPCSSIDHEKFQEDGRFYEEFALKSNTLCPESPILPYGGSMGTNLWVIPTKNS